jgi:hypothetical protein
VKLAVVPVFIAGSMSLAIFLASFVNKNAYWKLERFDYVCGFFSLLALVLWATTKNPTIAIFLSIAGDAFAAIPTLAKSWRRPETENISPYAAGLFSACTSFAAVEVWNFSEIAFPVYLIMIDLSLILLILRKRTL